MCVVETHLILLLLRHFVLSKLDFRICFEEKHHSRCVCNVVFRFNRVPEKNIAFPFFDVMKAMLSEHVVARGRGSGITNLIFA